MRKISITVQDKNETHVQLTNHETHHIKDGISIDFCFTNNIHDREIKYVVDEIIKTKDWISVENDIYFIDLNKLGLAFPSLFNQCQWMNGLISVTPIYEDGLNDVRFFSLTISEDEIREKAPKKVFLSHKGANKPLVRKYYQLLKELGFDPWIDEEDMPAGVQLMRSIRQGFKQSCAVVFFITPEFKDEKYLEKEIDYAIKEQLNRKQFTIITLQFEDEQGNKGLIPEMLEDYVWKTPQTELEAFKEIIKSLPIKVGHTIWK
ncbi:toll/interleukin-1 receptor domain-containing protein [Paenibacillus polymyxa]|uniref:toll/interleukin-1 receptor domain-containing protein n=1 Tax=Paenibacillus polymyxa TaxID=1406 RepID=UPI001BE61624|nr:toll/interleukin-1 receptor domain-containing protein [Paenibacillus polymyxa]MBT2286832.1 toll/interleukin-1 receptor domain-containing protein [Paenibacillus polymyxa]